MNPIKIHLIYSARSFVSNNGIEVKLYDLENIGGAGKKLIISSTDQLRDRRQGVLEA